MISRLLIANRGEIAVRVARTAKRLGIEAVAVYSEADAGALHVRRADLAVALGGRSPAESYLRVEAVLDAALRTACDALHPGYGFLAENAEFAQRVIDAGLVWVGPTPEQMRLLGDKLAAKRAAIEAGVPTSVPVEIADDGTVADTGSLAYPLLVKAAAGGGGRGMRVVREAAHLDDAIAAAGREAASAFGDGTVFVEPFVERGRHVEVQIVGDRHGDVVHLGERECSIQRRNQKIVEEAPSPGIDEATRQRLLEGAVALARHVGYESTGTVEFLVAEDGSPHFLEVNTRLQVEHPVTEATTGLDLVELQLRVAAGEPLGLTQDDVSVRGHAIEVRVVAEDPAAGWLPAAGTVHCFSVPDTVRVDTGVDDGSDVSTEYDSLLAKVIAHGSTRHDAARSLRTALAATALHGPATNLGTLVAILGEAAYRAGETFTTYLDDHREVLDPRDERWPVHLVAAVASQERASRAADRRWAFAPSGWRNLPTQPQRRRWRRDAGAEEIDVAYSVSANGTSMTVTIDDEHYAVRRRHATDPADPTGRADAVLVEVNGVATTVHVSRHVGVGGDDVVWTNGFGGQHRFEQVGRFAEHDAVELLGGPVAPLPGTIAAVEVAAGDHVAPGDTLVVLEAMKMEHRITADRDAVVEHVAVAAGDRVEAGDVLVTFRDVEDEPPGDG